MQQTDLVALKEIKKNLYDAADFGNLKMDLIPLKMAIAIKF